MKNILPNQHKLILQRLGVLLVAYSLLRLIFFFQNHNLFESFELKTIFGVFVHGVRFDLSGILIANLVLIFLWLMPERLQKWKPFKEISFWLFIIWNYILFSANTADSELYNFNGKRLTFDYFRLAGDIQAQAVQLIGYYWHLASAAVILAVLVYKFSWKWDPSREVKKCRVSYGVWTVLFLVGIVIGVRGGLQLKPLRPTHAYIYSSGDLGALTLNSTFSLFRGKSTESLKPLTYFSSMNEVKDQLRIPKSVPEIWQPPQEFEKPNIVILLIESLSLEYMGLPNGRDGYTPFLDELIKKSYFLKNNFANGRRSIEAIPSVLASIPSLMPEPFSSSSYQTNKVLGMGTVLKKLGYHTSFFHGAENGSMFFDSFTRRLGFDHYFGLNEYPRGDEDFDGSWGIFDGPFINFALNKWSGFPKPFASVFFSLSSHQPYSIPKQFEGKFPKGTLEIHESIGYVDFVLREFFERAKSEKWFNNTLFIITGDHTQKSDDPKYRVRGGNFRVPLMIYHPKLDLSGLTSDRISSHVDILPTILDWLGEDDDNITLFGRSLFFPVEFGRACNFEAGDIWCLSQEQMVLLKQNGDVLAWDQTEASYFSPTKVNTQRERELKAIYQYFVNGLIENSL